MQKCEEKIEYNLLCLAKRLIDMTQTMNWAVEHRN